MHTARRSLALEPGFTGDVPHATRCGKSENRRVLYRRCRSARILEVEIGFFNCFLCDNSSLPCFRNTLVSPGNSATRPPRVPPRSFSTASKCTISTRLRSPRDRKIHSRNARRRTDGRTRYHRKSGISARGNRDVLPGIRDFWDSGRPAWAKDRRNGNRLHRSSRHPRDWAAHRRIDESRTVVRTGSGERSIRGAATLLDCSHRRWRDRGAPLRVFVHATRERASGSWRAQALNQLKTTSLLLGFFSLLLHRFKPVIRKQIQQRQSRLAHHQ